MAIGDDVPLEEIEREHIARMIAQSRSVEAAAHTLEKSTGIDVVGADGACPS